MVTSAQLIGKITIEGADQAKTILLGMSDNSKKAQDQLNQLQNVAKDVGSILSNRLANDIKTAQSGLQDLGSRASAAGLDVSKLSQLQQKASEAAAKLGVAQAQAASAQEKANTITNDASASVEKIALAQARATLAAENVQKAELAAGDAMTMLTGEATRLADSLEASQAKSNLFSNALGGLKEGASGFFGAIAAAPAKLAEATQKIGLFIFGAQQIIQTGKQVADVFVDLGKQAGDFQSGITQLSTGAGELNSNLGMISDSLLKMAPDVGTTTKQLESGMYLIESAGFRGAEGLQILKNAAEGAKVQTADLGDVANGVTTALTDYGLSAKDSASVTNDLVATVKSGKTTMGELSSSLKDILPIASTAGISLNGVSAAMSTMTGEGVPAGQAANFLKGMVLSLIAPSAQGKDALANIGLTSQQVASEMRDSLPDALKMITDHLKNKFPEGSAAYMEALKQITGGSESLTAMLDLTGDHMKTLTDNVENIYQAVKKGGDGITGWAKVQQDFNFQMQRAQEGVETFKIKLGEKLFPVFSQVFGWVSDTAIPALGRFSDWFFDKGVPALQKFVSPLQGAGQAFQDFVGHGQAAIPILAGIGAVIGITLAGSLISVVGLLGEALGPFILLGGAVAGLTALFLHFYNNNAGFRDFINKIGDAFKNVWGILSDNFMPIVRQVGNFISDTFAPAWQQLQDVWKSQLQPALESLMDSFKRLQPVIDFIGKVLGGVFLVLLGAIIGQIGGLIGAIAGMAQGVAEIIGGVVQIVSGFVQTISGIVQFIIDLFTGHFDKLKGDLDTILGGVGQVFSGFGNVLKGIVDGIVGGVTGAFKGMSTSVIGYLNDLVHGVDDKTKKASIASQLNTAQMKDKSIENAQKMSEGTQMRLINMRNGIEDQLKQTTDATEKHTLEMKLKAVNNSLAMAQETGINLNKMRYNSQEQIDLLKQGIDTSLMSAADKAKYHSLRMKDFYLGGVIEMDNESIKKIDDMKQKILDELGKTTDGAKKKALEIKLTQVTNAEDSAKKVKDAHVKMRTDTESEMDKLKKSISDKSGNIVKDIQNFFGGIGKWFGDRWHDVQNVFGGIGNWFHDRWSEAWSATTDVFGAIGGWFHDRWVDVQNIFGAIGQWFSDRWNEVMDSTRPFRDFMGAVFETIWNILVALWGKLGKWFNDRWEEVKKFLAPIGQWFHDRWQEAWNAVTAAFGAMGQWFHDRWVDTQNVFGAIGAWFHDRWAEAWNAIVAFFAPIGKWFSDRWNDVTAIFGKVGAWFHDRFQEAWAGIVAFFAPIGKWFSDRWNDVMNGVNAFKKSVSDKFNEIKTDVSNIFKGMINGIIDQLNNGISAVESFINFFGQGLDSIAKGLGTKGTIPVAHLGRIPHYASGTDSHPGGPAVVGERGRELVFLPKGTQVAPNNITEMLLSTLQGGKIPGYADGVGDIGSKIMDWISGGAKSILDNVIATLHISAPNLPGMDNIASGLFDKVKGWALGWVDKLLPKFDFGGTSIPGNVQSWIAAAMSLTHVPGSWASPLGVIAMHESGGNPSAVNNTDSNAKAGHPSQGLFQTIPSTFAAYALPGHGSILNPIDNAAAAIGYIKSRYGDVFHVPGILALNAGKSYVGYANGGIIQEPIAGIGLKTGTNYAFGERGKELVTPYVPSGVNLSSFSNSTHTPEIHIHNHHYHHLDGKQITGTVMTTATKTSRRSGPIRSNR